MKASTFKIYNASAGSGKTYTLAKSYIKLLVSAKTNEAFKYILALTFTNKAVGEMKTRIVEMLKNFSSDDSFAKPHTMFTDICEELNITPEVLKRKSETVLKHILHNYGAFDISTIDGFTHRIIRTFAHDLKLPAHFEVELDQERFLNEAVDSLIAKAGTDETLTKTLIDFAIEKADDDKSWDISYDFNKIAKLLVNENDLEAISHLKEKSLEDFTTLKTQLLETIKSLEIEIVNLAESTLTLIEEAGLEHSDFTRKTLPNHFVKASQLELSRLYDNKLEESLSERKGIYPARLEMHLAEVVEQLLPQIETHFLKQKQLVFQLKLQKGLYKNMTPLSVLNAIQKELEALKSDQNKMLISEFNTLISDEIKDQPTPFIYERLGEKYKHYFIDEFQDTSKMQWENLVPLFDNTLSSTNGSVMLVGDAKQAIYRWRGGEAEQFVNLYNKTQNPFFVRPEVLELDTNYRSSKTIIEFNNSFFKFVGNQYLDDENHSALYSNSGQNSHNEFEGFVNLQFLEIQNGEAEELYAENVLETIQNCLANGYRLKDISVLVRKRKEGVAIANYLTENSIRITSSETLLLKNSPKVRFINLFLELLTQPKNEELRVRFLMYLAEHYGIDDKHHFFVLHNKSTLDKTFESLQGFLLFLNRNQLLQMPLYDLVEHCVRLFYYSDSSNAYLQFYLDVVLEFTQKYTSDISEFIAYFKKKQDSLSVVSPEHLEAVQIMTIHKSKGLEFPIVIFPYADLNIYKEIEPKIWFPLDEKQYNGFNELLLNYNKDVEHFDEVGKDIYKKHQSQLELDAINLLYVVLTRAVNQLYVISKKDIDKKGEVNSNTYSGMLINYLQQEGIWNVNQLSYSFGKLEANKQDDTEENIETLQLISTPKENHNLTIVTKSGLLWDTKQEAAIERGNLIHLVLSKIKTQDDIDFAFNDLLLSGEINIEQKEILIPILKQVVKHPKLKPYFSNEYTIYNEQDILTPEGQSIRPDRLLINSNNETVIIDYKTGKEKESYAKQLETYKSVLEKMNYIVLKKIIVYINDTIKVIEV